MSYASCQSHCCERHGCKYGHDGCPVVNLEVKQDHQCEYCPGLEEVQSANEVLQDAMWMLSRGFTLR